MAPLSNMPAKWVGSLAVISSRLLDFIKERLSVFMYLLSFWFVPKGTQRPGAPGILSILLSRSDERGMHAASLKHGLALPLEVNYVQIPVCGGYTDLGEAIVEIVDWPFLQPHLLESWTYDVPKLSGSFFYCFFCGLKLCSKA